LPYLARQINASETQQFFSKHTKQQGQQDAKGGKTSQKTRATENAIRISGWSDE
jgi:hypothetical protein